MDKIFKHNPVKDNTPLHSSLSSFKRKVTENIEIRGALLLNELIANDTEEVMTTFRYLSQGIQEWAK